MDDTNKFRSRLISRLLAAGGASAATIALVATGGCSGTSRECFEWATDQACPSREDAKPNFRLECGEKVGAVETDGDREGAECCYEIDVEDAENACCPPDCVEGRPLVIDGQMVVAPTTEGTSWLAVEGGNAGPSRQPAIDELSEAERRLLSDMWTRAAQAEHASIASFSRLALELMALGAPPALIAGAHRAGLDEVRHASDAFALASAYRGAPLAPGPLPLPGALELRAKLTSLAVTTAVEACVNETLAALLAAEQLVHATDPAVGAALGRVVGDETRHAELGWTILRWAIERGGEPVRKAVGRAFGNVDLTTLLSGDGMTEAPAGASSSRLAAQGWITPESRKAALRLGLDEVVFACANALLTEVLAPQRDTLQV